MGQPGILGRPRALSPWVFVFFGVIALSLVALLVNVSRRRDERWSAPPAVERLAPDAIWRDIGKWTTTAYTADDPEQGTGTETTSGWPADWRRAILACDDLPFGTVLYVEGIGHGVVADCIGGRTGEIDILFSGKPAALEYGRHDGENGRPEKPRIWLLVAGAR